MKRFFTGIILLLICSYTFPQKLYNLSHQVLVPAGNLVTHPELTFQQTAGEAAVEVSLPSFYNISQGYQQPRFIPPQDIPTGKGTGSISSLTRSLKTASRARGYSQSGFTVCLPGITGFISTACLALWCTPTNSTSQLIMITFMRSA
jgi:hypothetical protein